MTLHFACREFIGVDDIIEGACGCEFDDTDDVLLEAVIDQASDILSLLSGGKISGVCTATVRPIGEGGCWRQARGYQPGWSGERFGGIHVVPLRGPATSVVEVVVDGVVLGVNEYGLLDNQYLYRKNGSWPSSNNLKLDDSEVGTWSITFKFGNAPDWISQQAAIELACNLAKEALGRDHDLPNGITSGNIQGASVAVQNAAAGLRSNPDQLPMLQKFLGLYGVGDTTHASPTVWSPELDEGWHLVEVEGPAGS